jgi:hypothetical protein
MYGLGVFLAPFIVEPFLLKFKLPTTSLIDLTDNSSFVKLTTQSNLQENSTIRRDLIKNSEDILIHWPFIINSIYYTVVLVIFILIYIFYPDNSLHPSRNKKDYENDTNIKEDKFKLTKPLVGSIKTIVIVLATLSMHVYVGKQRVN